MTETAVIHLSVDEKGAIYAAICDMVQALPDNFTKRAAWSPALTDSDKAWLTDAWKRWRKDGPK